jgi:hypothetical protein
MGIPVAALIRVLHPDNQHDDRLFLSGSFPIGSCERCEIKLRDDTVSKVHAVLEWSGVPNRPHLRPLGDEGLVKVNDDVVHPCRRPGRRRRVQLRPHAAGRHFFLSVSRVHFTVRTNLRHK